MYYATPSDTAATIQAALASDDVTLSGGSQYNFVTAQGVNNSLALKLPAGRVLDLAGATIVWAGITGQTLDTDGSAMIGWDGTVGGTLRNGILRGPTNRVLPGARANGANRLISIQANGVTFAGLLEDLTLYDGPNQAISLLNVNGLTLRRLTTVRPSVASPATGGFLGHYIDLDVTANNRLTQAVVIDSCDLDSFGHECLKMENVTNIRMRNTRFRNYVTLVQDVNPYSSFSDVEFDSNCRYDSFVSVANLKRQGVSGVYGNGGLGTLKIRGRFVGDDALIYGGDSTVGTGDTNANQFAGLTAELCSFEGRNSHCVPVSGHAWITQSSGVKDKLTIYAARTADPKYPYAVTPYCVAGATGSAPVSTTLYDSLLAARVSAYFLDARGVTLDLGSGTLTGANNLGSNYSNYTGVCPIDFVGAGSANTIIDAQGAAVGVTFNHATNTSKQRLIGVTIKNATNRGWLVNNAAADVEFYDVVSQDCTTTGGGGGGRTQAFASIVLGPGTKAKNCSTTGATNGGGFLLSASGTSPITVEGVSVEGCSAGGNGGGIYNQSAYCTIKSLELVNNVASAGTGGLFSTWSVAGVTQSIRNVSGRGNVGSGTNHDVGLICGTATGKISILDCVFGSGGTVLSKTGNGDCDYGRLNLGLTGTVSVAGGTNTLLAANQSSDPLFVDDTTSVVLKSTSPCKGAASPSWTVGTNRPTLAFDGAWFQVNGSSLTTMGARP